MSDETISKRKEVPFRTELQLFNDDCFNILPTIANASVDLIVIDPPFG